MVAIAGILGIVLGRLWDRRSEASRWRRDQRADGCQRLAEAFILVYENTRAVALAEPGTTAFSDAVASCRNDKSWDNALAAVWFHGTPAVVTAASGMDDALTRLFYDAQERTYTQTDWTGARRPSAEAFERFIAVAREELDLAPVSVKIFPYAPG
jgi:hypothetical protein